MDINTILIAITSFFCGAGFMVVIFNLSYTGESSSLPEFNIDTPMPKVKPSKGDRNE